MKKVIQYTSASLVQSESNSQSAFKRRPLSPLGYNPSTFGIGEQKRVKNDHCEDM